MNKTTRQKSHKRYPLTQLSRVDSHDENGNQYWWSMPSADTLTIPPIRSLVSQYLAKSILSIDPFSRNCTMADITNDLNPDTSAQHHMKALDFLVMLKERGVSPDLVIFDPPYSRNQMKRTYNSVGLKFQQTDSQHFGMWTEEKRIIKELLKPNGYFIHFGYHSNVGKGLEVEKILLIAHGANRNDTIVTVARKTAHQYRLF